MKSNSLKVQRRWKWIPSDSPRSCFWFSKTNKKKSDTATEIKINQGCNDKLYISVYKSGVFFHYLSSATLLSMFKKSNDTNNKYRQNEQIRSKQKRHTDPTTLVSTGRNVTSLEWGEKRNKKVKLQQKPISSGIDMIKTTNAAIRNP